MTMIAKEAATSSPNPRPSRKPKASGALTFALPTDDAFLAIGKRLRLSLEQTHNLQLTVRHALADLQHHQEALAGRAPRSELVMRIERLSKAAIDFKEECDRQAKGGHLEHILPLELRAEIGRMLTFSSIVAAVGGDVVPQHLQDSIRERVRNGELTTIQGIEQACAAKREALGLNHASALLPYLIERLSRPLADWLAANKLNDGGRPGAITRNYLIGKLAESAPEIIGRKAGVSKTGPFVRLSEAVLEECGLDTSGLSEAIPRILEGMRKKAQQK